MILITGVNGFIGSHIARILVNRGLKVRGLVRKTGNLRNIIDIQDRIELIEGDVRDRQIVKRSLEGIKICYHLATLVKSGSREEYLSCSLGGTTNVCDESLKAGVEKIVFTSSCVTLKPADDDYSESKHIAEKYVRSAIDKGLPATITNPGAVMGPGDINITPPGRLMLQFLRGKIPFYFETGFNVTDVRDVASAHVLAAEKGRIGERYVIGNHNVYLSELFPLFKKVSDKRPLSFKLPYRLVEVGALLTGKNSNISKTVRKAYHPFFLDSEKTKNELGWIPEYPLETTLKDAWKWYSENKSRA